jgi:maleylacetoacetate isomerase
MADTVLFDYWRSSASYRVRIALNHGDKPNMADLCLVPQIYNARRWNVDLTVCPRAAAIADKCAALPAFVAGHPDQAAPK